MNAAGQRRLTPWLVAVCAGLAMVWIAFVAGIGRGIHWKAPGSPPALPIAHQVSMKTPPPLADYAAIWQHPLFTTTREPAPEAAQGSQNISVDNLELTGVILAPGMHMALLRDHADGHGVRVREGAHLSHGDWVLKTLKPRSALFVNDGRRTRLTLKTAGNDHAGQAPDAAPADATSADKPSAPRPSNDHHSAADAAQQARVKAIKQRIEQRRRQQAAQAGEH